MLECPGHFGYMRLAMPIFHIGFFGDVINILQCICKQCGFVLLDEDEKKQHKKRMQRAVEEKNYQLRADLYVKMRKECKKGANQKCKNCGHRNGSLKKMPKMPTTISFANHAKLEPDFRYIRESDDIFRQVTQTDRQECMQTMISTRFLYHMADPSTFCPAIEEYPGE